MKRWIPLFVGLAITAAVLVPMLVLEEPVPQFEVPEPIVVAEPPPPRTVAIVSAPKPVETELPPAGRVNVPGQGLATVVPHDPANAPSPEAAQPLAFENPDLGPEKPQTAEWHLEKTDRMSRVLDQRIERLRREHEAAVASGDETRIQRTQVQLERHQARIKTLEARRAQLHQETQAASAGP